VVDTEVARQNPTSQPNDTRNCRPVSLSNTFLRPLYAELVGLNKLSQNTKSLTKSLPLINIRLHIHPREPGALSQL